MDFTNVVNRQDQEDTEIYIMTKICCVAFRLTLRQSRPNKASLKYPSVRAYVRTSVCPQKVSFISVKFGM